MSGRASTQRAKGLFELVVLLQVDKSWGDDDSCTMIFQSGDKFDLWDGMRRAVDEICGKLWIILLDIKKGHDRFKRS